MRGLPSAAKWSCFHVTTLFSVWAGCCCGMVLCLEGPARSFEMRMVYKYSEDFQQQMNGRPGMEQIVSDWPPHTTLEFYHDLALQDRHRHASRNLLTADVYSLLPTNMTFYLGDLGGLHFSLILLGTPPLSFLVALDTGSDLLWVPCDCQQCSVPDWAAYGFNAQGLEFSIYNPSNSSTSKSVACNDAICTRSLSPGACDVTAPQPCTYSAVYLSANTSSSGTIVQDVIYLNSETTINSSFASQIYLGCGKLQTGKFLTGGAPNGLFGLGPDIYSVPSTFARNGITKNVFSMCFSQKDGSGRLIFGRKPAASVRRTPIITNLSSAFYVLGMEGFVVGGVTVNVTRGVVFDTGTSITLFPSTIVNSLGDALSSASSLPSFPLSTQTLPLTHCWNITTKAEFERLSSLSIVFSGGELWTINRPLINVTDQSGNFLFACLGMLSSTLPSTPAIIGFNFMRNYEYFFDQETSTFSWSPSDCYSTNGTSTAATTPSISPESPPVDSASLPAKKATAPKSSPPPTLAPPLMPPPSNTSQFSLFSKASSISFHPVAIVLLIPSTFFLLCVNNIG